MSNLFTHLTFIVSDLDNSINFYKTVCELDVIRDRRKEGDVTVWIGPKPPGGELPGYVFVLLEGKVTDKINHTSFQCPTEEKFEEKVAQCRELGIIVSGPDYSGKGTSLGCLFMTEDPDGHRVEFTLGQPIKGVK